MSVLLLPMVNHWLWRNAAVVFDRVPSRQQTSFYRLSPRTGSGSPVIDFQRQPHDFEELLLVTWALCRDRIRYNYQQGGSADDLRSIEIGPCESGKGARGSTLPRPV